MGKTIPDDNGGETKELEKGFIPCQDVDREEKMQFVWKRKISEVLKPWKIFIPILFLIALWRYLWNHAIFTSRCPSAALLQSTGLPAYTLEYAPLVWLDMAEAYFPSDISAQVENTSPEINFTAISNPPSPLTLQNLDSLNKYGEGGDDIFLTSNIDITTYPQWLDGVVPDSTGKTNKAITCAIIINDHGSGLVDAFYMYFYAYNRGNTVLYHKLGNHVGDWEHNMIRFQDGYPQAIWYSQHNNGEAFTYSAVEKVDLRPICYSARGSHANYATAGTHDHTIPDLNLPAGFIQDYTSKGILWDPLLSTYSYYFNAENSSFSAADDGKSPIGAMKYKGKWGDDQYPANDSRQSYFWGFWKFVGGPTGPVDKQLNRTNICPDNGIPCIVRRKLGP